MSVSMEGAEAGEKENYQVFHLFKRGKQHVHAGNIEAHSYEEALWLSKEAINREKSVYNIWVAKEEAILKIEGEDFVDIWDTLSDKKYRDAIDYKATEKIKQFKAEQNA